jgi:hypothetical protein
MANRDPWQIRLSDIERDVFKAAAQAEGLTMSGFMRRAALDRATGQHWAAVYDVLAGRFHRDTGMHAPGKDAPPAEHPEARTVRQERWHRWLAAQRTLSMGIDTPREPL